MAYAQPASLSNSTSGTFLDISGTGQALNLSDDGSTIYYPSIGNTIFPVDGNGMTIGNNGALGFGPQVTGGNTLSPTNVSPLLTNPGAFGGRKSLLAFWDDPGNNVGNVWVQEIMGVLYVQWTREFNGDSSGLTATWQVQIDSAETGGRLAQFFYPDMGSHPYADGGVIATIGFQAPSAISHRSIEWSHNQAGAVNDGTVLTLLRNPCAADFNQDGFVDDADFVVFSASYELFVCPANDPYAADFNYDGFIDDQDLTVFAEQYDLFVCQ